MNTATDDEINLTRVELKVLQSLEKAGEPVRLAYLVQRLNLPAKDVKRATERLVSKYEVLNTGDGRYQIATFLSSV